MLDQLQKLEARYTELENLLASPEVLSDREKSNKLARELSSLREPVFLFRDYKRVDKEIEELENVLK